MAKLQKTPTGVVDSSLSVSEISSEIKIQRIKINSNNTNSEIDMCTSSEAADP